MNKLLHIIASPRGAASRTLGLASVFVETVKKQYPQVVIDELNLFTEKLPDLFAETIKGKYLLMGGADSLPDELKPLWRDIETHINRFLAADTILISVPMWNFGIPYILKHYIDVIFQPRYLFKYTADGPVGLAAGRKMFVITTRGGDYGPQSPFHSYDLQEPYIRNAFGFVGISDIKFINAQPMDAGGPDVMKQKFAEMSDEIRSLKL